MTVLYIAVRSRPARRGDRAAPSPPSCRALALVAAVAVYLQMVLGGLVRHSGAALACTDVPLCRGSLWPRRAPDGAHPGAAPAERASRSPAWCSPRRSSTWRRARPRAGAARAGGGRAGAGRRADLAGRFAPCSRSSTSPPSRATWRWRPRCWRRMVAHRAARRARDGRAEPSRASPGSRPIVQLAKPRITGLVIITFVGGLWLAPGRSPPGARS